MSVPVSPGRGFDSGHPSVVFRKAGVLDFETAPDGQRFLLTHDIPATLLTRIVVALGGTAEIGRRTP